MKNNHISKLFAEATESQKEAATVVLCKELLEFELCAIGKAETASDDDCALHSVSSSSREGMTAMSKELLQNLKKQWGEVELCSVLLSVLKDCDATTKLTLLKDLNAVIGLNVEAFQK